MTQKLSDGAFTSLMLYMFPVWNIVTYSIIFSLPNIRKINFLYCLFVIVNRHSSDTVSHCKRMDRTTLSKELSEFALG